MTSRWQCFKAPHRRSKGPSRVTSQSWRGQGGGNLPQLPYSCKGEKETQREVSISRAQGPTLAEPGLAFFSECPHFNPYLSGLPAEFKSFWEPLPWSLSVQPACASTSPNHFCPPSSGLALTSTRRGRPERGGPGPKKTESSPSLTKIAANLA